LLIVGLGYGTDVSEHFNERMRDLSPSAIDQLPTSGGGEQFLRFITEEVVPFVEANYRTMPGHRTLVGISIGGLFALYTLFRRPEIFNRYIISSPSVFWDNGLIFKHEEQFAQKQATLSGKVFLSVGGLENAADMIEPIQELVERLLSRNYEALEVSLTAIEGETHFSVHPAALAKGMKAVF
jgi:predicted alpha/beta superfamily hydrolase